MHNSDRNVERLVLNIPISPPLSPDDIANIVTSVGNLAMNRNQIRADDIELTITRAPETTSTQDAQRQIDAETARLTKGTAELQSAIDKEKK